MPTTWPSTGKNIIRKNRNSLSVVEDSGGFKGEEKKKEVENKSSSSDNKREEGRKREKKEERRKYGPDLPHALNNWQRQQIIKIPAFQALEKATKNSDN